MSEGAASAVSGKLPGDAVARFTAISFALAFVAAMRRRKDLSQLPSVRTTVALPRFLTARALRKGGLTVRDYIEAAVYLTPAEDQGAAFEEARALLFPKEKAAPPEPAVSVAVTREAEATETVAKQAAAPEESSLLSDLAGLNLDMANLDLAALDQMLDAKLSAAVEMKSVDLVAALASSEQPAQRSLASLIGQFGGAAEIESEGATDEAGVRTVLLDRLRQHLGSLEPEAAVQAGRAGLAGELLEEVRLPWERAGLLAGSDDPKLAALLEEVLRDGTARELGRTLRFVKAGEPKAIEPFRVRALATPRHLSDWAEILDGLGEFVAPPPELVTRSAIENLPRALAAADALQKAFGGGRAYQGLVSDDVRGDEDEDEDDEPAVDLHESVFDAWAASLTAIPDLDFLADVCVPGPRWSDLVQQALELLLAEVSAARRLELAARMELITRVVKVARKVAATGTPVGKAAAGRLATAVMELVQDRGRFLPLLDALLDVRLIPGDGVRVVAAGTALGISEEEIYARLSQPLEQLRFLITGNVQDLKRCQALVGRLDAIPEDLLRELIACCVRDHNVLGLALLLAIALGPTAAAAPASLVDESLGHKGIGGGENLLLQWFEHRDRLPSSFKERIKALARQALIDAALVWMHRGTGGAEKGLVPQARTRPYRQGDSLDDLDIEGTLEALVSSGKTLDGMGTEDLVVSDTASGRAGFGVLIDISGSMSGKDLAVCAIAVVMLLGRLRPEEVAIALFESNTHVIKGFAGSRDLEQSADELLELRATGGTCVDAALRFIAEEFAGQADQETRVLFLLSDFQFFEDRAELQPSLDRLATLDVRFIGGAHGSYSKPTASLFAEAMGGQIVRLPSLTRLPEVLLQALGWISEGAR